jgi:ClpP class serine protease
VPLNPYQLLVRKVSDHYDTDIILYIGLIDRPHDDAFIRRVKALKRRRNVILILTTPGGDPHAAYSMARCLQAEYKTVTDPTAVAAAENGTFRVFVDTRCKSAGTILATGANTVMFSDFGEMGPIDVQLRKVEEVGERSSGLTPMNALDSLAGC